MSALRLPKLLLQGIALLALPASAIAQNFTNQAGGTGVLHVYGSGTYGGGVSFFDFNNDGWDDLTLASQQGDSIQFYKNDNGVFQRMPSLVTDTNEAKHLLWVDYDNDGDNDLFVTTYFGGNRLYRNDGNLSFTDVTAAVGLPQTLLPTFGATWADYDNDGFLDLYITNRREQVNYPNYLYRNDGNGSFVNTTLTAVVADSNKKAFGSVFFDWNQDGHNDLYVAHDNQFGNTLFENQGNGTFSNVSQPTNANLSMNAHGMAVGDYDGDGDLDIFLTNGLGSSKLLRNNNNSAFSEVAGTSGVGLLQETWSTNFLDADNDGLLDLFVCGSGSPQLGTNHVLYMNQGNANFSPALNAGFNGDTSNNYASAIGDFNNDGFADIAVLPTGNQKFMRLWKSEVSPNNWVKIKLIGTVSNRMAIGSRVEVFADSNQHVRFTQCGSGFLGQNSQNVMVGLGTATMIDSLRITWPNGTVETFFDVCPNRQLTITEGQTTPPNLTNLITTGSLITCGDSVIVSAGNFPNYQWSTGDNTPSITVYNGGNYQLTVTDNNGLCAVSQPLNLPIVTSLEVNIAVQQGLPCFGDTAGVLTASASGGSGPLQYIWSNGVTTNLNSGLTGGDYGVTVVDSIGCKARTQVFLAQNTALTLNGWQNTVTCQGLSDGTMEVFAYGGVSPFTYNWSGALSGSQISGLSTGIYHLTVTDAVGCQHLDTLFMPEPDALQPQVSVQPPSCYGLSDGDIQLNPTGGTAPYAYQWSQPGLNGLLQGVAAGQYDVTVTDANGCTTTNNVSVVQPDSIQVSTNATPATCFNYADGVATVTASGGTGLLALQWINGVQGSQFVSLTAGTYPIVVTDANGCSKMDSAVVTQPSPIDISLTANSVLCYGDSSGSVSANAVGGTGQFSYSWSSGQSSSSVVTGLPTGQVTITVTDANGCAGFQSVLVDQPDDLGYVLDTVVDALCFGEASGEIHYDPQGGTPPYDFTWTDSDNNTFTGYPLVGVPADVYTFEVSDSNGCSKPGLAFIGQPTKLLVTGSQVSPATWGANGAGVAFAQGGTAPYEFLWGDPGQQTNDTAYHLGSGSYSVTVTDANGCTDKFTVGIGYQVSNGPTLPASGLNWTLYPNPANDRVFLEITGQRSENLDVLLMDATGRLIRRQNITTVSGKQTIELALGDLPGGLYLVQLGDSGHRSNYKKLIVK